MTSRYDESVLVWGLRGGGGSVVLVGGCLVSYGGGVA